MRRSRLPLTCALAATACALSISTSAAAPGASGGALTVTEHEFGITLSRMTLPHGVPIAVTVSNRGTVVHEAVPELPNATDHALRYLGKSQEIGNIAPGKSKTGTWMFAKPGTYKIACHVKGHAALGMHITVTVT